MHLAKHYLKPHRETTEWHFIDKKDYNLIISFLIECEEKKYTSAVDVLERFLCSPLIRYNGLCGVPVAVMEKFFNLLRLYITTEPKQAERLTELLNIKPVTTWTGPQIRAYRVEQLQSLSANDNTVPHNEPSQLAT